MAESDNRDERRLPASARKLAQARESGDVPRSRELSHAAALLAAIACVGLYGQRFGEQSLGLIRESLRFGPDVARDPGRALTHAASIAGEAFWIGLPLVVTPLAAALVATIAVGGLVFTSKPLMPDLSRLDPVAGLGRLFSINSVVDLGKLVLIAAAIGVTGAWIASNGMSRFASYSAMAVPEALGTAAADLKSGLIAIALVVILAAAVDAPLQIFRYRRKLMMTPEEAKQEYKEQEGNPQIKGKIKERQRAISRARMLAAVPTADVVVTNPTHYAVALKYEDGLMAAPRVVAKGADLLAARIREIAQEAGVPMLESPPLARALYRHVELDAEIPAPLYSAVAQVLAWVYQLSQHAAGRAIPPSVPSIVVPPGLDPQEKPE